MEKTMREARSPLWRDLETIKRGRNGRNRLPQERRIKVIDLERFLLKRRGTGHAFKSQKKKDLIQDEKSAYVGGGSPYLGATNIESGDPKESKNTTYQKDKKKRSK